MVLINDFAIFYRTNAQSSYLKKFLGNMIFLIFRSIKFYNRKEIKDIIAYLKVILNPNDLININELLIYLLEELVKIL